MPARTARGGAAHAIMANRNRDETPTATPQPRARRPSVENLGVAFLTNARRTTSFVSKMVGGVMGSVGSNGVRNDLGSQVPTAEMQEASSTIARFWWKHRFCEYLDRTHLLARLELEDSIGRRMLRLLVNSLIFVFLVRFLSLGNPASEKLSVRTLLTGHLFDKQFYRIRTLDDLRDYLPILSEKLPPSQALKFSVSAPTAARASEDDALKVGSVLQSQRHLFTGPLRLHAFQPRVTSPFSLAAWIEHPISSSGTNASAALGPFPVVRQPMSSTPSLSCWGWHYPPQLRYGAHDFFASTSTEHEEVIRAEEWAPSGGDPVHEVVTVDQDIVTFYTNGVQVGEPRRVRRKLTECALGAAVEVGDAGMALSSLKFYHRALSRSEVEELYLGGQPLVELAAGSSLHTEAAEAGAEGDSEEVVQEVKSSRAEGSVRATVFAAPVNGSGQAGWVPHDEPTFPPDPSPPAWLPGGAAKADRLPAEELAAWEAGGSKVNGSGPGGFLSEEWRVDAETGRAFYSVFEQPIYADGSTVATLPDFGGRDDARDGATVSFWMRSLQAKLLYGPHLKLWQTPREEWYGSGSCGAGAVPEATDMNFQVQLDWVTIEGRVGQECQSAWWFMTWFDPEEQSISEEFLVSAFAQEPRPLVWRHVAYRFDVASGGWSFFLDGHFVYDTALHGMAGSTIGGTGRFSRGQTVHQMLSGARVTPHSWTRGVNYQNIPAKVAQFRVYMGSLSDQEVLGLQDRAVWPHSGAFTKECIEPARDFGFADTAMVDRLGHTCQWHQSHVAEHPYLCNLPWLKRMCAVTCAGRRTCHGGQLSPEHDSAGGSAARGPQFQVFDRVMHVVPSNKSVLCPRSDLDIRDEVARCRTKRTKWGPGYGGGANYTSFLDGAFHEVKKAMSDLRDCDELEAALRDGAAQCAWDAAGLEEFEKAVNDTGKAWSLNFWIRPKEQSLGMPSNFWFAVNVYSSVAPPMVLAHWHEVQPTLEPWLDAYTTVLDDDGDVDRKRAAIYPTTSIDYTQWTMMHMQVEPHAGSFRLCATLNNLPMACTEGIGPPAWETWSPRSILSALELSTEMLVSPLQFTTELQSPSEVQRRYYREAPRMALKTGPRDARNDLEGNDSAESRALPDSDLRVALLAPPVLFQSRAVPAACDSAIVQPFIDAQLDLLEASFCFGSSCRAMSSRSVASCPSDQAETGTYWGRSRTNLRGEDGYTEFLSVVADNPVVVRSLQPGEPPELLQTRYYLDGLTTGVHVLMLLLNPQSGLISLLDVFFDVSLPAVKYKIMISHLGTVMGGGLRRVWVEFGVLLLLLLLFFLLNFVSLRRLQREARVHQKRERSRLRDPEFTEVVYGLVECCVVCAFAVWWLVSVLLSEEASKSVVRRVAGVEWTSQALDFDTKVENLFAGVASFDRELSANFVLQTIAFFLLLFMLLSIMQATAVHPKMRALTGSFMKSIDDLWHFSILATIIFIFFATAGWWTFGGDREDFRTGTEAMTTQLNIILGVLPVNFNRDFRLSTYVMLTTAVFFLLMLNFLLAIVVEGYMKVRGEMSENKAAYEFFTDMALTARSSVSKRLEFWPPRRELIWLIRQHVEHEAVNGKMLRDAAVRHGQEGLTVDGVRKAFDYYFLNFPKLRTHAPANGFSFEAFTDKLGEVHGIDFTRSRSKGAPAQTPSESVDGAAAQSVLERILQQVESVAQAVSRVREEVEAMKHGAHGNGAAHASLQVSRRRRLSATSDAIEAVVEHPRKLSIPCLSADLVIDNNAAAAPPPPPSDGTSHSPSFSGPVPRARFYMQDDSEFASRTGSGAEGTSNGSFGLLGAVPAVTPLQGEATASVAGIRALAKMASRSSGGATLAMPADAHLATGPNVLEADAPRSNGEGPRAGGASGAEGDSESKDSLRLGELQVAGAAGAGGSRPYPATGRAEAELVVAVPNIVDIQDEERRASRFAGNLEGIQERMD